MCRWGRPCIKSQHTPFRMSMLSVFHVRRQLTSITIGHDVPLGQLTHAGVQEMPNLRRLDLTHGLRSRGYY